MRPLLFLLALTACAKRVQDTTVDEVEVTTVRRAFANVHWVEAGELTLLVDTGIEAEADALVEQLRALGKDPAELDLIIATIDRTPPFQAVRLHWAEANLGTCATVVVIATVGAGDAKHHRLCQQPRRTCTSTITLR